jgi:hypothetical protein
MAEIVNIQNIDPNTFEFQDYSSQDTNLIFSTEIQSTFSPNTDNVEYFVYDLNGNILYENPVYSSYGYSNGVILLDPEKDLRNVGYDEGNYNTLYNFVQSKLGSNSNNRYYISQISPDRTEVRLDTTAIANEFVVSSSLELTADIANATGSYYDFYLNFGNNDLVIANNILLDNSNPNNPTVLIKLYEPLPQQFGLQSQCWAVIKVADSVAYNINITVTFDFQNQFTTLQGPNINVAVKDQINNSTDYTNLNLLSATTASQGSGSFQYQLNNLLAQTGITLNIDYSDYANFINFSSAQTRLENFYYKLSLIESYQASASLSSGTTTNYYVSSSNVIWQSKINEIITEFDGYEYYLYYNSGSTCWPKSNSTPPYTNVSTTSTQGEAWIVSQSLVAEQYDLENNNALIYAIPSYLLEDSANDKFKLFVEMIGQFFDNIYSYIESITEKYNADNRVNYGVSKDLVADILKDMGIKIYQNNFSTNDLYSALLGFTPSGSLYNLPYTTGSLPTPSGYEYINTYVTASATGSLVPTYDINAEIYKRIYHNLPYLLKKKGTVEGLKALITLYGIPDTILNVNEFGGQDKDQSSIDYWLEQYDYAYSSNGAASSSIYIPFKNLNSNFGAEFPRSIQFRFKTNGLPTSSIPYSQSLIASSTNGLIVALEYTGSGYSTGSYSGSIYNNDYQYANLKFIFASKTASVYLPFFDGNWWSVMLNADTNGDTTYTLYAGSKTEGYYGGINYEASSSFTAVNFWNVVTNSNLILGSGSISYGGKTYLPFSGSYQEFRYYNVPLSASVFESYVVNPYSIEGNNTISTKDTLAFRLPLGGELYTGSTSVHPAITGSSPVTQSFTLSPYTASFSGTPVFGNNTETFYFNQPPVGIKNIISNKVRNQSIVLPYSSSQSNIPGNTTLSPYRSVQQNSYLSSSFTQNVDYVEVAFSPQNVINNDIAEELGYFNIGEYIGDPRLVSSSAESYPALDALRDYYFSKYTGNYNIWDYIRLIKYFDNSLFKMIADWVPARTDLASGIVIKQTILERNKYPVPQANISTSLANVGSGATNIPYVQENILFTGSIPMESVTGSDGGTLPDLGGQTSSVILYDNYNLAVTQSWTGSTMGPLGPVTFTDSYQYEFFDGAFSGSELIVTTQSLTAVQDYDVLVNNAIIDRTSSVYFDVDYSQQGIIPVNQGVILSQSADHAAVQDSNYTLFRNISPRYLGSKNTSAKYNVYTSASVSASLVLGTASYWPGDQSYGKTAAIDKYADYFVYFDWIGGSNPEYPGGGNIHLTYLIDLQGNAYPLTGDNKWLDTISNIFVSGQTATILPSVYSAGTNNPVVSIVEGGALIDTIVYRSGSDILGGSSFGVSAIASGVGSSFVYNNSSFTQSTANLLTDSGSSGDMGWLYYFLTGSSTTKGYLDPNSSFNQFDTSPVKFINKNSNTTFTSNEAIPVQNTYFSLQLFDYIRFGTAGTNDMDFNFTGKQGLFQVTSIITGSDYNTSSSLGVVAITGSVSPTPSTQNWRIMRRVPKDNFVLVQYIPSYRDSGLLIPNNFNPNYDPYTLARKAGLV